MYFTFDLSNISFLIFLSDSPSISLSTQNSRPCLVWIFFLHVTVSPCSWVTLQSFHQYPLLHSPILMHYSVPFGESSYRPFFMFCVCVFPHWFLHTWGITYLFIIEGFALGNMPLWVGGVPETHPGVPGVYPGWEQGALATVCGWGNSPLYLAGWVWCSTSDSREKGMLVGCTGTVSSLQAEKDWDCEHTSQLQHLPPPPTYTLAEATRVVSNLPREQSNGWGLSGQRHPDKLREPASSEWCAATTMWNSC